LIEFEKMGNHDSNIIQVIVFNDEYKDWSQCKEKLFAWVSTMGFEDVFSGII